MLYLNSFLMWLNLEVNWEDFESRCFVFNFTAVIPKRVQGRKKITAINHQTKIKQSKQKLMDHLWRMMENKSFS